MKLKWLLSFFILSQLLSAQTFVEVNPAPPFESIFISSVAFADIDGDNDQDVLITGGNTAGIGISKLYINDSLGNFTEVQATPFEPVYLSSIAFADIDNDNDQDVLITGRSSSSDHTSKLYANDGMGSFTEVMGTTFEGIASGSVAFADVDSDNDLDVLISGFRVPPGPTLVSKLYLNDGEGTFTEKADLFLEGVFLSSVAFADIDSDDDLDLLITGKANSDIKISQIYVNDGVGNYSELMGTTLESVDAGSVAFADIDGDNDQDLLLTGRDGSDLPTSKLYINDGGGNFTEIQGAPFEPVSESSIAFADVDNDDDLDVLLTGITGTEVPISKLYINDGAGNFSELSGAALDGVSSGSVAFADVSSDGNLDVLITGKRGPGEGVISKLYINEGVESSSTEYSKTETTFSFTVFPNPSTSPTLFLSCDSAEISEVTISVYSINGLLLRKQKEMATIGQQVFPVDVEFLPKGNYFIELDNGKGRGTIKFVVQ